MAFVRGLEFDTVATTYILFLPFLLLVFNELLHRRTAAFHHASFYCTALLFSIYLFASCADLPYFRQFGSHLNRQAFIWNESPGFVLGMIFGSVGYYGYLLLFFLAEFIMLRLLRRIFASNTQMVTNREIGVKWSLFYFLLAIPFLIVGARGRISMKSTTHEGRAIVSDSPALNQVALNANFTLFRSLFFQKQRIYKVPADIRSSFAFARRYFGLEPDTVLSITRDFEPAGNLRRFNVVIVCMESMSMFKTGVHGRRSLTPDFNKITGGSLFYDQFFSSGIHTFNGVFSSAAGFPSIYTEQPLRRYTRKPFVTLGNLLEKKGYTSFFFSTHDPHFDNMAGFLTLNGYKNIYSSYDVPSDRVLGPTGIPDHELYDLFVQKINETGPENFVAMLMTGSDHGPWNVPGDIAFNPDAATPEERSTQYADWSVGQLILKASKQKWFDSTLFVFTGDHGYLADNSYDMPLSYHHVPLALYMPSVLKARVDHRVGYQPDIVATVAGVLNLSFKNSTFGIDLRREFHPFVFFTADDKIGSINDSGFYYYKLIPQNLRRLKKYKALDQQDYFGNYGAVSDSLELGSRRMLDVAEYIIRSEYYNYN
jgi:phosphoglycerol transferase MdoB-like AlkP superfamily enzyme